MLDWGRLLSSERLKTTFDDSRGETAVEVKADATRSSRTPFEADYGRIVFSAVTRRLAGKTQVHPFSHVDYVHNRLTHSLEVSTVAYSLAREAARFLRRAIRLDGSQMEAVGWIVRSAALAHDLGNPPYGHAGEFAIRQWAAEGPGKGVLPEAVAADFRLFDGNAQTFRLLSRSDLRDSSYFRLTLATLGAGVKYPFVIGADAPGKGKFSAFVSERDVFDRAMDALGLKDGGRYLRHPLSYLVEAADDICYLLGDLEDAIALHVLREEDVKKLILKLFSPPRAKALDLSASSPLQLLRARAIDELAIAFANAFRKNYDAIDAGCLAGSLDRHLNGRTADVMALWRNQYKVVFKAPPKIVAEIGAYQEFSALFDKYAGLLGRVGRPYAEQDFLTRHLVDLAWSEEYFDKHTARPRAWWAHAILDFVTGMTDRYMHELVGRLG